MAHSKRGANFTSNEKEYFKSLVSQHIDIIQDKRTTLPILKKKNKAWEAIKKEYNGFATSGERSVTQLKHFFDNIKQSERKRAQAGQKSSGGSTNSFGSSLSDDNYKIVSIITEPESSKIDGATSPSKEVDAMSDNSTASDFDTQMNNFKCFAVEDDDICEDDDDEIDKEFDFVDVTDSTCDTKKPAPVCKVETKDLAPKVSDRKGVLVNHMTSEKSLKKIYLKRKCENAFLERKKLLQEMSYMKKEHVLKMKFLKNKVFDI